MWNWLKSIFVGKKLDVTFELLDNLMLVINVNGQEALRLDLSDLLRQNGLVTIKTADLLQMQAAATISQKAQQESENQATSDPAPKTYVGKSKPKATLKSTEE